jgi:hypothetical protein
MSTTRLALQNPQLCMLSGFKPDVDGAIALVDVGANLIAIVTVE